MHADGEQQHDDLEEDVDWIEVHEKTLGFAFDTNMAKTQEPCAEPRLTFENQRQPIITSVVLGAIGQASSGSPSQYVDIVRNGSTIPKFNRGVSHVAFADELRD